MILSNLALPVFELENRIKVERINCFSKVCFANRGEYNILLEVLQIPEYSTYPYHCKPKCPSKAKNKLFFGLPTSLLPSIGMNN